MKRTYLGIISSAAIVSAVIGIAAVASLASAADTSVSLTSTPTASTITATSTLLGEDANGKATSNSAVAAMAATTSAVQVNLTNASTTNSYSHVHIAPVGAGSHIQMWAQDSVGNWYDINVAGFGDPTTGFPLPSGYSATTSVYIVSDQAGSYPVTYNLVNIDNGTTIASGSGTVTVNAAAVTPAAPTVTSVSPTTGSTAGGTAVTITGTGFTGATAVYFGSTTAPITVSGSGTSITATSPATTTAGMVDITVVTPNGTSTMSAGDRFTYTAPTPTAPVISNVMATPTGTSTEVITWNTDSASTGQVWYGTSSTYSTMALATSSIASTTHTVTLTGLSEATLYHFAVTSSNAGGNATSSDMTFNTQSTASSTPLQVTGISSDKTSATADGSFADGWQWTLHFIVPSNETYFAMKFADFADSTTDTIPANGNIRYYSPQASDASTTNTAIVETNNGYGGFMTLNGDTSTTTPGRQVDVVVQVAVPSGTPTGSYSTTFGALSTTTNH